MNNINCLKALSQCLLMDSNTSVGCFFVVHQSWNTLMLTVYWTDARIPYIWDNRGNQHLIEPIHMFICRSVLVFSPLILSNSWNQTTLIHKCWMTKTNSPDKETRQITSFRLSVDTLSVKCNPPSVNTVCYKAQPLMWITKISSQAVARC